MRKERKGASPVAQRKPDVTNGPAIPHPPMTSRLTPGPREDVVSKQLAWPNPSLYYRTQEDIAIASANLTPQTCPSGNVCLPRLPLQNARGKAPRSLSPDDGLIEFQKSSLIFVPSALVAGERRSTRKNLPLQTNVDTATRKKSRARRLGKKGNFEEINNVIKIYASYPYTHAREPYCSPLYRT